MDFKVDGIKEEGLANSKWWFRLGRLLLRI